MVEYDTLKNGDAFIYSGDLCIKAVINDANCGSAHQFGLILFIATKNTAEYYDEMCGEMVIPVDAEVKWSYKKTK